MRKLLNAVVFLFAFIGAFAIAYLGFQFFLKVQGAGQTPVASQEVAKPAAEETTEPANPQIASLVEGFRKLDATPTPAPEAAAAQPGTIAAVAPASGAGGTTVSRTVAAATAPTVKPIQTPDGSKKLIREWPSGRKWVALTFDDGPHPEWTPQFIELLRSKNVKATFFLVGPNVQKHQEIARSLVENGFEVANHTMNHPDLKRKDTDVIRKELSETQQIVKEVTGVDMTLMRPPYGNAPKKVQDVCDEMGLKIITWNIDTEDWEKKSTAETMEQGIMKNLKDGCIILMHDRHEKSYNATAAVIDKIRAQGYEFVTVSELLGFKSPTPSPAAPAATPQPVAAASSSPAAGTVLTPLPAPAKIEGSDETERAVPGGGTVSDKRDLEGVESPSAVRTADGQMLPAVVPGKLTTPAPLRSSSRN